MKTGIYKGYTYHILGYAGFNIDGICSWRPLFGNKIFLYSINTVEKILMSKIRYTISKHIKRKNDIGT